MKWLILCLCFTLSLCNYKYNEKEIWGKPCVVDNSVPSPGKSAEEVVRYTKWLLEQLDSYKDEFIQKLEKDHKTFHEFAQIAEHEEKEWLRKFNWFAAAMLPKVKLLGIPLTEKFIKNLKIKINIYDGIVTKINAASRFLVATLNEIIWMDMNIELMNMDLDFRRKIMESMRIIRSIICSMDNYMKSKNYKIENLREDFLPKNMTRYEVGLMLRDTYNYFEYIKQLFETFKVEEYIRTEPPYEPELWANPCHYSPPISYYFNRINKSLGQVWISFYELCVYCKRFQPDSTNDSKSDPEKGKKLAPLIYTQALKAFQNGLELEDEYVSIYEDTKYTQKFISAKFLANYPSFCEALPNYREDEWLRKLPWYRDEVLPKSKDLFTKTEHDYLSKHLMKVFPEVLPLMHKGAKMILSGLDRIKYLKINEPVLPRKRNKKRPPTFHEKNENYAKEVQSLLCLLSDFLRAKGQEQLWLFEGTRISYPWAFPIFRDSVHYLVYIAEVFEYIVIQQDSGQDPYAHASTA